MPQPISGLPPPPRGVRAVAFDVYQTLADWPPGRLRPIEVQELLAGYNVDISYQAYEAARQYVFYFDAAKREVTGWTDFLALLFARMGVSVSLDLLQSLAAKYQDRDDMAVFDDAVPALEACRAAGLTTCAFTTLPRFMLGSAGDALLPRLDHYFDITAIGLPKGDRRFYERIAERLGVPPQAIVCVGDDPLCDCLLPSKYGWRAVWLNREGKPAPAEAAGLESIRGLNELPPLLHNA